MRAWHGGHAAKRGGLFHEYLDASSCDDGYLDCVGCGKRYVGRRGRCPGSPCRRPGAQVAFLPANPACTNDYNTGYDEGYRAGLAAATKGQSANAAGANPCPSYPKYTAGFNSGYASGYSSGQTVSAPGGGGYGYGYGYGFG